MAGALHSVLNFFTHSSVSVLFSATGVTLKALPVCLSVCCLSLFGFCSSLCSLFTMSIQKCHSALSWAASAFTHTYTKHAHKCQLLKPFLKGGCSGGPTSATNYNCCMSTKHICDIILKHQFHQKLFFLDHVCLNKTGFVRVINLKEKFGILRNTLIFFLCQELDEMTDITLISVRWLSGSSQRQLA